MFQELGSSSNTLIIDRALGEEIARLHAIQLLFRAPKRVLDFVGDRIDQFADYALHTVSAWQTSPAEVREAYTLTKRKRFILLIFTNMTIFLK